MYNYSRIQYISNGDTYSEQLKNIESALNSGVNWVQLRWKQYPNQSKLNKLAESCKKLCDDYKSVLIINDQIDTCKDVDADGVHLGLNDASISLAKAKLGSSKIIGGTANTYLDVLKRCKEECDYIGLGPFRFTKTKQNLSPVLGIEGYQKILIQLEKDKVNYPPIFAIGGVLEDDIVPIAKIGIYGIAVSGLIQQNPDVIKSIKNYYEKYVENSR